MLTHNHNHNNNKTNLSPWVDILGMTTAIRAPQFKHRLGKDDLLGHKLLGLKPTAKNLPTKEQNHMDESVTFD